MKLNRLTIYFAALAVSVGMTSCLSDDNDTIILENGTGKTDIPSDKDADYSPYVGYNNVTIPNIQYTTVLEDGTAVVRLDMTGIQDTNTLEWLRLLGTGEEGQNVWVEVDGKPKGIKVYNSSDSEEVHSVPVDLVFTIDNSGSMGEEANAIARDVADWANKLSNSGLDIRFGCVGFDGAINGALNLTTAYSLTNYLNRDGYNGTSRTMGFEGSSSDVERLSRAASNYRTGGGSSNECGLAAIRFADENFSFRSSANRIYVNFTDEPNQDAGISRFHVGSLLTDWESYQGTIHTVYSAGNDENNYLMSQYTGGTVINTNSSFTGVTLESLPVTDAMRNSYIIRFTDIEEYLDGQPHTVKITIYSPDGSVQAERTFTVVFGEPTTDDDEEVDYSSTTTFNGGFGEYKGEPEQGDSNVKINFVGQWKTEGDGTPWYLTFYKDGSGRVGWSEYDSDGDWTAYKIENSHLWVKFSDQSDWEDEGQIVAIDKDTFKIQWENGWWYTFRRIK